MRQWPRLRGWLEGSREFRAWQEQLRLGVAQWQASGHDPGALLFWRCPWGGVRNAPPTSALPSGSMWNRAAVASAGASADGAR
ncbi:hypothetical protein [Streptomyces sp. NPDC056468]|uniref:nSTAND1 domain-containing NTPase n=1 Tax=Streptomyces sp. NPDC056468 TaxID=3345830 RepID=UPI003699A577